MGTKHCNGCGQDKPLTDFWLKRGKPQHRCKECQSAYHKKHYVDNKDVYLQRALVRGRRIVERNRSYLNSLKDVPCMDCGEKFPPYAMDFDHRGTTEKLGDLSWLCAGAKAGVEVLKEEAAKCDVVCAVCHRIRTHKRHEAKRARTVR